MINAQQHKLSVSTKKQKKQLKAQILGKPPYLSRSTGDPSPTAQ